MKAVGSYITSFDLNVDDWTPIVAAWSCSYYMIIGEQNGKPMWRCSDTDDAKSFYKMNTWGWFFYSLPALYQKFRFKKGDTVTFLKATVPGSVAIVEFYY